MAKVRSWEPWEEETLEYLQDLVCAKKESLTGDGLERELPMIRNAHRLLASQLLLGAGEESCLYTDDDGVVEHQPDEEAGDKYGFFGRGG